MSPKLPRDVDGIQLAKRLCSRFGYEQRNRVGRHIVLQRTGTNLPHITIPAHKALAIGTLSKILSAFELQTGLAREDLLRLL